MGGLPHHEHWKQLYIPSIVHRPFGLVCGHKHMSTTLLIVNHLYVYIYLYAHYTHTLLATMTNDGMVNDEKRDHDDGHH